MSAKTEIGPATNGGESAIEICQPYRIGIKLIGDSDILFHAWNCEAVAEKAASAKGSKAKKSDNVESYVYRNDAGDICLPGEYVRMALIGAAKFAQDPRSPRKSAVDIIKAGVQSLTPLASLGSSKWDYEHKGRVTINRAGLTRTRPAFKAGWTANVAMCVILPEYIDIKMIRQLAFNAGRLIGVGDFRPTYGRFSPEVYLLD